MKITSKGQVTIPQAIREAAGLLPNTEVEFVLERGAVRIVKSKKNLSRGDLIIRTLREARGNKMSADEIMKLTRG